MNAEEWSKLILKIICPLSILTTPYFLYLFWQAPNPSGNGHLDQKWYVFISCVCLMFWIYSIIFTLKNIGMLNYFGKKK